jgi:hypothetical protein
MPGCSTWVRDAVRFTGISFTGLASHSASRGPDLPEGWRVSPTNTISSQPAFRRVALT